MSETVIIAHPNPDETQCLGKRVGAASKDRLILETHSTDGVHALLKENECTLLLLESSLCPPEISNIHLSETTALLILADPSELEKYAKQLTGLPGINDVINSSSGAALLRQKTELLLTHCVLKREFLKARTDISSLTHKLTETERSLHSMQHYFDMLYERDGLTGLYNRKYFSKALKQKFEQAEQNNTELSLLLLDVDYFSEINRNSGQVFGDFVLNEIAARLTRNTEDFALSFRFGGGSFIIMLPQTNIVSAKLIADRLRKNCAGKKFNNSQFSHHVTVSIGISSLIQSSPETPGELLDMADKALYQAKAEGRNRCTVYSEEDNRSSNGCLNRSQETLTKLLDKTKTNSIASIELLTHNLGGEEDRMHIRQALFIIDLICDQMRLTKPIRQTLRNSLTLSICLKFILNNDPLNRKSTQPEDEDINLKDLPFKLVDLTKTFDFFNQERQILFCQQEWYNGEGYPEGLQGNEIPMGSKIINLADSMAAMVLEMFYDEELPPEHMLNELVKGAGRQWDPQLVILLLDIIKEKKLFSLNTQSLEDTREKLQKIKKTENS